MKNLRFLLGLASSCVSVAGFAGMAPQLNSELGQVVTRCKSASPHHVWIFKQWHLSPSMNTKDKTDLSSIPQEKNQTAIYRQLDAWVGTGQLQEIYAEGCSGELNLNSALSYNGWTIGDLKKASEQPFYPTIVTSVPLKIEAKYDKKILTLCGDNLQLVKEGNLAFSDARGALGFLTRITQYKSDPRRVKTYLDGVIDLYKMPPSTTADQAIAKLKVELKSAVGRAKDSIEKRNGKLVDFLKNSPAPQVAVVFGGIHAAGIVRLLDEAGIGCSVIEPIGYQDDEGQLLKKLDDSLQSL